MLISTPFRRTPRNSESGYALLWLLLLVAVATIAFAYGILHDRKYSETQSKRDREEEMIHRGVQYSRAIQAYYRKFNRYPVKIEDLENTNQIRFLRRRYKDPLTGKDFKLLHYGEAKLMGSGMGGGTIPGASTVGANGQLQSQGGLNSSFGSNSSFGNSFGQNSGYNQNSAFGQNNQSGQPPSDASQTPNGQDSSDTSNGSTPNASGQGNSNSSSGFGSGTSTNQFGGAPIVGVASLSKDTTIREFDKKRKYNEWQFIYDPTMDRGGLIKTPYQPQLMNQGIGTNVQNMNGQNGTSSPNGNGFGNSGFGNSNSSGFGNSFGNSPGGMQNNPPPSQPSNPPQQQ